MWGFRGSSAPNLWNTSVKTRSLWVDIMSADPKEGINSVQTLRNMAIAVSLLAAAQSTFAAQLMTILTDPTRLNQLAHYAAEDPISSERARRCAARGPNLPTKQLSNFVMPKPAAAAGGSPVAAPELKVGIGLGLLFLSLMFYAQSARGSIHLGFVVRVMPTHPHIDIPLRDEAILLVHRTSLYFSIGLRILYLFFPTFFWTMGTTPFLVSMVVVIVALTYMDQLPSRPQPTGLVRTCTNFIDAANMARDSAGSLRRASPGPEQPPAPRGGQDGAGGQRRSAELAVLNTV